MLPRSGLIDVRNDVIVPAPAKHRCEEVEWHKEVGVHAPATHRCEEVDGHNGVLVHAPAYYIGVRRSSSITFHLKLPEFPEKARQQEQQGVCIVRAFVCIVLHCVCNLLDWLFMGRTLGTSNSTATKWGRR